MPHKRIIIEHGCSPLHGNLDEVLRQAGSTICRRGAWSSSLPELLQLCPETLLLANAVPSCEEALRFFHWLGEHPIGIPTVAILPSGDHELLQAAAGVVDDFLLTPVREEELRQRLARLAGPMAQSLGEVQATLIGEVGFRQMVGQDPAFVRVLNQIKLFGASDAPVLLTGETGTGKEMCARMISSAE